MDKPLFFDHLVAYRPGFPLIPLLDFHDAFFGGSLWLSGHFSQPIAEAFAAQLNAYADNMLYPTIRLM